MPALDMIPYDQLAIHDTGAPVGDGAYTTLVIIHGYVWHSGVFTRILPYAAKYRTRIVLVNRRDYPGAAPLDGAELEQLQVAKTAATGSPEAVEILRGYFKERAKEIHGLLERFIISERLSKNSVVVVGWSLGVTFLNALLAYAPSFPTGEINIAGYIKQVVAYDAPQTCMGQPPPPTVYHPFQDSTIPVEELIERFNVWVSGYFRHPNPEALDLQSRDYEAHPTPTVLTMTEDEIASAAYTPAAAEGGSDEMMVSGIKHGIFNELRLAALLPSETTCWARIKWRHVWADQSIWEIPWSRFLLEEELEKAAVEGKYTRPVEWVRFERANHFGHWDMPDNFLRAVLG
ncbi:hypothetical protein BXZ70DRAFT_911358 [Cristinia sonorae]|uniref:AB hydrolase-1 domain-containing protein n=1 Tax=Cristinia sonorae TaxID=1940300 RepID=A0A8K0UDA7_9AGAR|nr:hypothetical protein BXZ70DRAFT_911358 [Cristinia sonorae]